MVEATPDTFKDLTREGNVLVDFWGPRCQPCLQMMPTVEKLEQESAGAVKVVKVNAAKQTVLVSVGLGQWEVPFDEIFPTE